MKFTKSLFGKENNDIEKFNELDLDERSIVFLFRKFCYFVSIC